jgi:hypothetical protein
LTRGAESDHARAQMAWLRSRLGRR